MKKARRNQPTAILRRMRRAVETADDDAMYVAMLRAMPFGPVWKCVSFIAEHEVWGKRRATVLRRIDRAIEARRK